MLRIVENEFGYFDLEHNGVLIASSTHASPLLKMADNYKAKRIEPLPHHWVQDGYTLRRQPRTITASVGA